VSRENVEIAERVIDAFNRRDTDAVAELITVDFEWFPAMPTLLAGTSFKGREGIEAYRTEIDNTWEEYRSVALEFRDLGDRVLMLGRLEGRGRGSGAAVDAPQGTVWDFVGGKISRASTYLDHAEALKAVGLKK
jgi:ketosteroid isomerase-like protein